MERIVIEDDATAKKWRTTSRKSKEIIAMNINETLIKLLDENQTKDFMQLVKEMRETAA